MYKVLQKHYYNVNVILVYWSLPLF